MISRRIGVLEKLVEKVTKQFFEEQYIPLSTSFLQKKVYVFRKGKFQITPNGCIHSSEKC